jgi:two-component system chemotaxis sensor kinase CheA
VRGGLWINQIDGAGHEPVVVPAHAPPVLFAAAAAAPANTGFEIVFTPAPALYAKANETALLLRELSRLGPIEVVLDESGLPDLTALDPAGAYLTWRITLRSDCTEAVLRDVFEFVEGDCRLDIETLAPPPPGLQPGDVITAQRIQR